MIVSSTELQNNFGKYLMLAAHEDIIITRNGLVIARLTGNTDPLSDGVKSTAQAQVRESAESYIYGGRKATFEEFLKLTEETDDRYEYIDGEIYYLASPRTAHQFALTELIGVFYNWFQHNPCTPVVAPYDITLFRSPEQKNVVQPDLVVICDLEEHLNEKDYYMGVPRLVVEILSESTRNKDTIKKLDLYMSCGVEEYWIANPFNQEVVVYQFRNEDIHANATYRKDEHALSYIFAGLTVEVSKIFRVV